jgi:hypothetical protein
LRVKAQGTHAWPPLVAQPVLALWAR